VESNKDVIKKLCEVVTSHQLTLAHLDVSAKVAGNNKEKALKKLDKWCDKVFNHTSVNGMCIVIFAGPKQITSEISETSNGNNLEANGNTETKTVICDSDPSSSSSSTSRSKSLANSNSNETQCQSEINTNSAPIPRRNGVCFIRINGKKV